MRSEKFVLGLAGTFVFFFLLSLILWMFKQETAATFIGTATLFVFLALVAAILISATSWWTRETMRAGAQIALDAQRINDEWDTKKTSAFADVVKMTLSLAKESKSISEPTLPLITQENWLPQLTEWKEIESPNLNGN